MATIDSSVWPLGPIVVCTTAVIAALLLRREHEDINLRPLIEKIRSGGGKQSGTRKVALGVAAVAGVGLLGQIVLHGRPAMWWLLGAVVGAVLCHRIRSRQRPVARIVIANARDMLIASGIGIAGVVTMQLILEYSHDKQFILVKWWIQQLTSSQRLLAHIVLMSPWQLVAMLVPLIFLAVFLPSLQVMRNYRRLMLAASRVFLAVTVAASFSFLGGPYVKAHRSQWVAHIILQARSQLGEIEADNRNVMELAALEDAVSSSSYDRTQLEAVGRALVDRNNAAGRELVRRIAMQIVNNVPVDQLNKHIDSAVRHTAETSMSPSLRESRAMVKRVRRDCDQGVRPRDADLTALEVERTRSRAAKEEARIATQIVLTNTFIQIMPGSPLVSALAVQLVTRVNGTYQGVAAPIDRGTASAAIRRTPQSPPPVYFDISRIVSTVSTSPIRHDEISQSTSSIINNKSIATWIDRTSVTITEEKQRAEEARIEREEQIEREIEIRTRHERKEREEKMGKILKSSSNCYT